MTNKQHDGGFGTVGILLTIIVLLLVGAGGWYVFHKNKKSDTNGTNTANSQQNKTGNNSNPQTAYLTVKELGIRLTLTDPIKDAYYKVKDSSKNGKPIIALYLHSWDTYANCTPEKDRDGLGAVTTFTPGESDPVNGDLATSYPDAPLIDGLHYYIAQAQSDCSAGAATNRQAVRDAFTAAYKTIVKE